MKISALLLTLIVLWFSSCSPRGELVAPPDGLEQAVRDYYAQRKWPADEIKGVSVRAYPNDAYFLTVEGMSTDPLDNSNGTELRRGIRYFIAQKAYQNGATHWQVQQANKDNIKLYGIDPKR